MSVLIDLHGAPGSQNGQDNSGLIGPVRFPDNTTNFDRSYAVLQNLSSEFSKVEYGGVVWGERQRFRTRGVSVLIIRHPAAKRTAPVRLVPHGDAQGLLHEWVCGSAEQQSEPGSGRAW